MENNTSRYTKEQLLAANIDALDIITEITYNVLNTVIDDKSDILYKPEKDSAGIALFNTNVVDIIGNNLKNRLGGINANGSL